MLNDKPWPNIHINMIVFEVVAAENQPRPSHSGLAGFTQHVECGSVRSRDNTVH